MGCRRSPTCMGFARRQHFCDRTELPTRSLEANKIYSIDRDAFDGLYSLQTLYVTPSRAYIGESLTSREQRANRESRL